MKLRDLDRDDTESALAFVAACMKKDGFVRGDDVRVLLQLQEDPTALQDALAALTAEQLVIKAPASMGNEEDAAEGLQHNRDSPVLPSRG